MTIKGHGDYKFIDGVFQPLFIINNDGKSNLEYQIWEQKDQLLASWLLSSIGSNIIPQLIGCYNSVEFRKKKGGFYMTKSIIDIMQYKKELQKIR